ncbi:MAG: hypothetical protein H9882_02550 [Candidatus Fournierella pullistercoris]|uniref:Transcriptional coactivator p15 (PC4) C-terminal domain-containing protein n=1 Tax=Candidatus Allofournierella pullistercoris TaxID=2838597 RepID=A0A948T1Q6_9FIRM|nr:hypothetical protein [Candidatus Fournierella pullistercoris]
MAEFKYEIVKELAVLSTGSNGWQRELNLVSWNDREAKYDIRDWAPDHVKMGKGISLSMEEMEQLKLALDEIAFEPEYDPSMEL